MSEEQLVEGGSDKRVSRNTEEIVGDVTSIENRTGKEIEFIEYGNEKIQCIDFK